MKKMMKLCAALLLAICLASVFVACGDDNGGELPGSDVYVLKVNGEMVKGEAIELGKDGKCLLWTGGDKEEFTYKVNGMMITLRNSNGRIISGTKSNSTLLLTMEWETRSYVKYSGKDWRLPADDTADE